MEATSSTDPSRPLAGVRILVAEDNPDNVVLATAILRRAGADVGVAWNGEQAVEQVLRRGAAPDVVLMDLMMPVMDGWTATKRLRASGFDGTIVALTALDGPEHREACLVGGCDAYLSKPYDPERLLRLLGAGGPSERAGAVAAPEPIRPELFARMRGGFARRASLHAKRLREAREAGDRTRLSALAHALKGSAGSYGYERISELASAAHRGLEEHGDDRSIARLVLELEAVVARAARSRS